MKGEGSTAQAFDQAGPGYDQDLQAQGEIFRRFRAVLWRTMYHTLDPVGPILEMGCGSGVDTLFLASTGRRVVAIDPSSVMLEVTRSKLKAAGLLSRVELIQTQAGELPTRLGNTPRWGGAISNLGPLNCEPHLAEVARWLGTTLTSGSHLILSPMASITPWEIALFMAKAKPARALVRLRPGQVLVPVGSLQVPTAYPLPSTWKSLFEDHFTPVKTRGLGVFLPPPYVTGLTTYPNLLNLLDELDENFAHRWPLRWCGDHHLMVWRRK